jgi:hypothetical protein
MEPAEDILHMAEAKIHIERLASNKRTPEYNEIMSSINHYLKRNCKHENIIEDYIDINDEQTQQIKYCNQCGLNM